MEPSLTELTLACGLEVEERAARKGGARAVRVGLGAGLAIPDGRLASFGLAGALVSGLEPGTLLTATSVVGEDGALLWTGPPLAVPGATPAVFCAVAQVVDEPADRARLARCTGAVAVDMESGPLAATGRLEGVVRAVSDSPEQRVGLLARAATRDGRTAWRVVAAALLREPVRSVRAALGARRALLSLTRAATALGGARS